MTSKPQPERRERRGSPRRASAPRAPVVAIGTSAGGLRALRTFFQHVPPDSGLAFVIVIHLSPEHESHLAELLQPHVSIPVQQVTESVALEPDRVYVIPPNRNLSAIDTHLRLSELEAERRERAPIDHFLRTLARTHDGHAAGVILTGTGSDGALGLKEIKGKGGLTVVQDPDEAEYDGMPQSALATGFVDLVLPLDRIPQAIIRFARTAPRIELPEEGAAPDAAERKLTQKVLAQVRARTGRDFAGYKRSTVLRRIARRMQLRNVEDVTEYMEILRNEADEARALADDLLITVTNFFRDAEVFQLLEREVVPKLFDGKEVDEIRVWSVGCATGEEAYSLAMLLIEEAARRETTPKVRIFASDLHESSLARARDGFYPGDIATDVTGERLRRFFDQENGGYRIRKEVRELVVFAPHNLLADPPFSRLDLITCRNLLIYLQRDVQRDVIELFHYALRPSGLLVLGTSETVEATDLFFLAEKGSCIHTKRNVPAPEPRLPVFPLVRTSFLAEPTRRPESGDAVPYAALHARSLERHAPPSVLVSADDRVVHLSGRAGRYLVQPGGEPTTSVLKLVREELRIELRTALHAVREQSEHASSPPIPVRFEGETRSVVLHASPAADPEVAGYALVIFEDRGPTPTEADEPPESSTGAGDEQLRRAESELEVARQRLQAIIEEYETSQEEMRASHEELQSANEELRSTMEELETSKEELQSMNEELQTVNQENRHKVEELAQLTSDLQNLLAATDVATFFLDRSLRILRFTPKVSELFNVRVTDRGRPLFDLTHKLGYEDLRGDAERVLATLIPIEREMQDNEGHWYSTRVKPYRSSDDRIDGLVITFVDITRPKVAEESLRHADRRKSEFLATLGHELRNPLAAIRNGLALLRASAGQPEIEAPAKEIMERQVNQMVRLIDDLLDVSRIAVGKFVLKRRTIDLASVLRDCIDVAHSLASDRDLELRVPPDPLFVEADPVRIGQVFTNLLHNACHFTEAGGHVRVTAERDADRMALVTVRDDGSGIPPEQIARIFDLFAQADTSRERSGLGIGLTLVKELVELHGGRIEARSEGSGRGSEFTVRLPMTAPAPAGDEATDGEEPSRVEGLRVLVVDDNRDAAASLALLFRLRGNQTAVAYDGEEALRAADAFRPEVVLLDIGLPELDGYEVARRLRERPWATDAVLIAVSGKSQEADRRRSSEAGFDCHMVKPVSVADLERVVARSRGAKG